MRRRSDKKVEGMSKQHSGTRRKRRLPAPSLCAALLCISSATTSSYGQEVNHNFCGSSWDDASVDCDERTHCPGADDNECPGSQICFADTLCDVAEGHGIMSSGGSNSDSTSSDTISTSSATSLVTLPYEDRANTQFCQSRDGSNPTCDVSSWCGGSDKKCPDGYLCHYSDMCHLHDILKDELDKEAMELNNLQKQKLSQLPPEDPKRYHSCGTTWYDANDRCKRWCWGDLNNKDECPEGQTCYADTNCYEDAGLVPSLPPNTYAPTSRAPTQRANPINHRFCGISWDTADCSVEAHCPTGKECKTGEECFTVQSCHMHDLTKSPTFSPSNYPTLPLDHPSYFMYCGKSYDHAVSNCSLRTRCKTDDNCPDGSLCFGDLPEECNALLFVEGAEFLRPLTQPPTPPPTRRPIGPSKRPTDRPTASRDDLNDMRFCGRTWDTVTCSLENHCPTGMECGPGEVCFTVQGCNYHDLTPLPTDMPTPAIVGPTRAPIEIKKQTRAPTARGDPRNIRFCGTHFNTVECSTDNWCPTGLECAGGKTCFTVPTCHIHDLTDAPTTAEPSISPTTAPPSLSPTTEPTDLPSKPPTPSPTPKLRTRRPSASPTTPPPSPPPTPPIRTDPYFYCGKTQLEANENCASHTFYTCESSDFRCPFGYECFMVLVEDCGITQSQEYEWWTYAPTSEWTYYPTVTPSKQPIIPIPTTTPSRGPMASIKTATASPINPSTNPTRSPSDHTQEPTAQPKTPMPVTVAPSLSPNAPTSSPSAISASEPAYVTNKQPNVERPSKPNLQKPSGNLQFATNDEEENASVTEENASVTEEELDAATINRPRYYCLLPLTNIDEDCNTATECSEGNPCATDYVCIRFDCKTRPPSSGSLDLCPYRYVGRHTKNCLTYYECDNHGYVGPTYQCEEGFRFDKSSGECMNDFLVNSDCYSFYSDESDEAFDESGITTDTALAPSESTSTMTTSPPISSNGPAAPTSDANDTAASDYSVLPPPEPATWPEDEESDLSHWYTFAYSGAYQCSRMMNTNWLRILMLFSCLLLVKW